MPGFEGGPSNLAEQPPSLADLAMFWVFQEYYIASAPSTPTLLVPVDRTRWYLGMASSSSTVYFHRSAFPAGATAWGYLSPSSGQMVELNYRDHGGLVQEAWFVTNIGGLAAQVNAITSAWRAG